MHLTTPADTDEDMLSAAVAVDPPVPQGPSAGARGARNNLPIMGGEKITLV